jgi:hypothetical protein
MEKVVVHGLLECMGFKVEGPMPRAGPGRPQYLVALGGRGGGDGDGMQCSSKVIKAREWGIPVVGPQWVVDCVQAWQLLEPTGGWQEARACACVCLPKGLT